MRTRMRHQKDHDHVSGCYYIIATDERYGSKRHYLPQVNLESRTTINPVCFTTKLVQTYHNPNQEAINELRYIFPLYDGVAVNGYTISYADKVLTGLVKQKEVAMQTYDAAVERGETAGLLESLPAGVFGVTLCNVPPDTDIVVDITYCGELKHDAAIDGLRYTLPTNIAPRYGSYPGELLSSNTTAEDGISITVDVDMGTSAIRKVQSPSHPIAVSIGVTSTTANASDAPFQPGKGSATLTLGSTELADDFILQLLIDDISKPRAIIETHPTLPDQRAIMATLVPKFALELSKPEIVFIADQSGSMSGSKNDELVKALKVFLKSLPFGIRFNICAFGNNFKFLWSKSQAYNESNVNKALDFVNGFNASYGGTEILKPITAAFEQKLKDMPMEVMLLTDGEIWAEDAVFSFINNQIRDKKVDARVFALGIGGDVSHTLVEGVARAGNGVAQFVTQNEDTNVKIMRMLKAALYPHTSDYQLEVHYQDDSSEKKVDTAMIDHDGEDDEDFEIIEKVNDCLSITDEDPPAYDEPKMGSDNENNKVPKSFYDDSVSTNEPTMNVKSDVDRYAHLPAIDSPKILQAPAEIPPLFPFSRSTVYLLLSPAACQQKRVSSITLRAKSPEGPLELTIPVEATEFHNVPTVHQLAARKVVQDLEEGCGRLQNATVGPQATLIKEKYESRFDELLEREAVRLGERFQIAGRFTSFVAVQDGAEDLCETQHATQTPDLEPAKKLKKKHGTIDFDRGVTNARSSSFMAMPARTRGVGGPSSNMAFSMANQRQSSSSSGGSLFGGMASALKGTPSPVSRGSVSRSAIHGSPPGFAGAGSGMFGVSSSPARRPSASPRGFGGFGCATASFGSSHSFSGVRSGLFGRGNSSAPPPPAPRRALASRSARPSNFSIDRVDAVSETPREQQDIGREIEESLMHSPAQAAAFMSPPPVQVDQAAMAQYQREMQDAANMPLADEDDLEDEMASTSSATVEVPATIPENTTAAMHQLISMQKFSGGWSWSDQLLRTLGIHPAKFSVSRFNSALDWETKATLLAVAFLETKVKDKHDVWELVVAKAMDSLKQGVLTNDGNIQTGLKQAKVELLKYHIEDGKLGSASEEVVELTLLQHEMEG